VRAVETSNGTVVQEFNPRVRRQIDIRPENLRLVQEALKSGVNDVGGTSRHAAEQAKLTDIDVAGKTGTAQVSHHLARGAEAEKVWYFNREHAWFAGWAPVKSPEVSVVALVEHGGTGGKHAAPIAFEAIRAYHDLIQTPHVAPRKSATAPVPRRGNAQHGGQR
jgi:penicillin-binding protein 2